MQRNENKTQAIGLIFFRSVEGKERGIEPELKCSKRK
jgi:hypothetical protein